jgi:hypothetical protein
MQEAPRQATFNPMEAPGEVVAPADDEEYKEYRQLTDLREPYK